MPGNLSASAEGKTSSGISFTTILLPFGNSNGSDMNFNDFADLASKETRYPGRLQAIDHLVAGLTPSAGHSDKRVKLFFLPNYLSGWRLYEMTDQ